MRRAVSAMGMVVQSGPGDSTAEIHRNLYLDRIGPQFISRSSANKDRIGCPGLLSWLSGSVAGEHMAEHRSGEILVLYGRIH